MWRTDTPCHTPAGAVRRGADLATIALWLLLGLGPIVALLVAAGSGGEGLDAAAPNIRRLRLFATSVSLGVAVALFTTLVSVLAAHAARRHAGRPLGQLGWLPLALIAVPPYVHANAWIAAGGSLNRALAALGRPALAAPDWLATFWVQSMAFLPVALGFALLGFARVEPALADAGHLYRDRWQVFARITLPLAAPVVSVGTGLVAVLSFTDFSTPALFQLPAYAMEIFVTFGSGADARATLLLAAPLVVVAVAVLALLPGRIETGTNRIDHAQRTSHPGGTDPAWFRSLQRAAIAVLALQLAVPLLALLRETGSPSVFFETVGAARGDLLASAITAAIAAALALGLAVPLSRHLHRRGWMLLFLLPLAIPGTLTGIGLIDLWNHRATSAVYGTPAMPVLAALARFTPIAILLFYGYRKTIPRDLTDAAVLLRGNGLATWRHIILPLYWRGIVAIFVAVFALALGELAASILVLPPGQGALSIRIFNLLHYGSTSAVASLCLLMLLVAMVAGLALLLLLGATGGKASRGGTP